MSNFRIRQAATCLCHQLRSYRAYEYSISHRGSPLGGTVGPQSNTGCILRQPLIGWNWNPGQLISGTGRQCSLTALAPAAHKANPTFSEVEPDPNYDGIQLTLGLVQNANYAKYAGLAASNLLPGSAYQ
jgi:hypothetical protein